MSGPARRALVFGWVVATAAACGARNAPSVQPVAGLRATCANDHYWARGGCHKRAGVDAIDQAVAALSNFKVEAALGLLEQAAEQGPHRWDDHQRLYEQRGIALAYQGDTEAAREQFTKLLRLNRSRSLSYRLSPKATFVFDRVRNTDIVGPALDVRWTRGKTVNEPLPLELEVVANPDLMLQRAIVYIRKRGAKSYSALEVPLTGKLNRVALPALNQRKPQTLQIYVTGLDPRGNEVMRWAAPHRPREIALGYRPPVRWYRKWWVWSIIAASAAATTGTIIYFVTREPPDTVDGIVTF